MSRGRPKGSGKRWTPFANAQLWARIEFIKWRDNTDTRTAARRMVFEGFIQIRGGKFWLTRAPKDNDRNRGLVDRAKKELRLGDERQHDPVEAFRQQYYAVVKMREKSPELRKDCTFWLRVEKEAHRIGDRTQAFENVLAGVDMN